MSVLVKLTLRQLLKNRVRTAVTLAGIILSVAMVCGVTSLTASLNDYGMRAAVYSDGDWHGMFEGCGSGLVGSLGSDARVSETCVLRYEGCVRLEQPGNQRKPYIAVSSVNAEFFGSMPVHLTEGRLPRNAGEIILPEHLLGSGENYACGDSVTFALGERMLINTNPGSASFEGEGKAIYRSVSVYRSDPFGERFVLTENRQYTVVGIYEKSNIEKMQSPCYDALTLLDGEGSDPDNNPDINPDRKYSVYFKASEPGDTAAIMSDYRGYDHTDEDKNKGLLAYAGVSVTDGTQSVPAPDMLISAAVIAVILAGSVLLIGNSFAISSAERGAQFALLSSVGATGKQIRQCVYLEGIFLLIPAVPVGLLAGLGGVYASLGTVNGMVHSITGSGEVDVCFVVSAPAILLCVLISVLTVLLSAMKPAAGAAGYSVIETVRGTGGAGGAAVKPYKSRKSITVTLGRNYARRDRRRRRSTVISLALSVVLFVFSFSVSLYLDALADLRRSFSCDVQGYFNDTDYEKAAGIYGKFLGDGSVSAASMNAFLDAYLFADGSMLGKDIVTDSSGKTEVSLLILDDASFRGYMKLAGLPEDTSGAVAVRYNRRMNAEGKAVLNENFSGITGEVRFGAGYSEITTVGGSIGGTGGDIAVLNPTTYYPDNTLQIAAVTDITPWSVGQDSRCPVIIISEQTFRELDGDTYIRRVRYEFYLRFKTSDHEALADSLNAILNRSDVQTSSPFYVDDFIEQRQAELSRNAVSKLAGYGLTVMLTLVSLANAFNTVSSGIALRRRDFAMLRSVGMSRGKFVGMLLLEAAGCSLGALIPGLAVSAGISALLWRSILYAYDTAFRVPWGGFIVAVAATFTLVIAVTLISFVKSDGGNTVSALKNENV